MTSIRRETKTLTREAGISDVEKLRLDLLCKWCAYCLSANVDADSKYIGAGLISMATETA